MVPTHNEYGTVLLQTLSLQGSKRWAMNRKFNILCVPI